MNARRLTALTALPLSALMLVALLPPASAAPAGPTELVPAATRLDCTVMGTRGDDVLAGTKGDDVICGLGGDDVIRGLGGDDIILGGRGHDRINGGAGSDIVEGGAGDDDIENAELDGSESAEDASGWNMPRLAWNLELPGSTGQSTFHIDPARARAECLHDVPRPEDQQGRDHLTGDVYQGTADSRTSCLIFVVSWSAEVRMPTHTVKLEFGGTLTYTRKRVFKEVLYYWEFSKLYLEVAGAAGEPCRARVDGRMTLSLSCSFPRTA